MGLHDECMMTTYDAVLISLRRHDSTASIMPDGAVSLVRWLSHAEVDHDGTFDVLIVHQLGYDNGRLQTTGQLVLLAE